MRTLWVVTLLGSYGCALSSKHVTVGEDNRAGSASMVGAGGFGGSSEGGGGGTEVEPGIDGGAAGSDGQTGGTGGTGGSGNDTGAGGMNGGSAGTDPGGAAGMAPIDGECDQATDHQGSLEISAGNESDELLRHVSGDLTIYATTKGLAGLRCLESIGGDLRVDGGTGVTNLNALSRLRSLGGGITLENTPYTSIAGLGSLESDALTSLTVRGNERLLDLDGLEGLSFAGGTLTIADNAALDNIDGLSGMSGLGTDIEIMNNDALVSLAGLHGLSGVTGSILINGNASLRELTGLERMRQIPNRIEIYDNDSLVSLGALAGVDHCAALSLYRNPSLPDLEGLENLKSVGSFTLWSHPLVKSLAPLDGLETISVGATIEDNPQLSTCEAEDFVDRCGAPYFQIRDNAPCD